MIERTNERVAYHNGEIKPESRVLVSFRDRGFKFGEAVFDTARTIRHKPFKPVTARLMDAYKRLLDFDFVAQYTSKL